MISNLCSIIEIYFYYRHHLLGKRPDDVYKKILKNETREAWSQAKISKKYKKRCIVHDYGFPAKKPKDLEEEEWNFLKRLLRDNVGFHHQNQRKIARFWLENQQISNIYKHTMAIVAGMQNQNGEPIDHIYLRGYRAPWDKKVRTFVVETSLVNNEKYEDIWRTIHAEFHFLLDVVELQVTNPNKTIIPPLFNVKQEEEGQLKSVLDKIPYSKADITITRALTFSGKAAKKILTCKKWVVIFNRDFFYKTPRRNQLEVQIKKKRT